MSTHGRSSLSWLTATPIAHRGLHDDNHQVPENSLPAASAAMASGYAIECDVQLSADGTPFIFHDDDLERLTGVRGKFRASSDQFLSGLRLAGTEAAIPSVREFLALVSGRVPIVMELKGLSPDADGDFVERLESIVRSYQGELAFMSFDDWLVRQLIESGTMRPVGLTAEGQEADVLERHRKVFDLGCAFTSYNIRHLPNNFVDHVRSECDLPVISWTIRTLDDASLSNRLADQMTFEGIAPQP